MISLLQRVRQARVEVGGRCVGEIGAGLLVLVCAERGDTQIIRFDHVSTRKAGQRRFVDLHMHMPAAWTLGRAAAVRTSVEQALMSAVPGLRASIQLLPSDVEAHFYDEADLK